MQGKDILKNIIATSGSEFYTPLPKGYKPGKTKYIVITGSVMSGIGKGTISSSLCKCLQDRGLKVEPMKLEAYLNVDSGTLNPFRHGEVFVLDDGYETDLDLDYKAVFGVVVWVLLVLSFCLKILFLLGHTRH